MNNVLLVGDGWPGLAPELESLGMTLSQAGPHNDLFDFQPQQTSAILVQLHTARGDAFRLMYRLRRALPRIPIIAIAPFQDTALEQQASRCGASIVLAEPLDMHALAEFVAGYCELSNAHALA